MKRRVSIESRHTCPRKLRQGSPEGTSPRSRCGSRICVLISATYAHAAAAREEAVPDVADATLSALSGTLTLGPMDEDQRHFQLARDGAHAAQHPVRSSSGLE